MLSILRAKFPDRFLAPQSLRSYVPAFLKLSADFPIKL
jgi:hypothetical protein